MTTETISTKELLGSLDETVSKFMQLLQTFSSAEFNAIPFNDSWTAGQLAEHMLLSTSSIVKAMKLPGHNVTRQPDEGVEKIKTMFLDFDTKLNAPKLLLPTQKTY